MKKTILLKSMIKSSLMLLATVVISSAMTSCSSDDDDKGDNSEVTQLIYIDKVEKAYEFDKCTYTENEKNTNISIAFKDGSKLLLQVGKGNFGKNIHLYEPSPKGYDEYDYDDVCYLHTSKGIEWSGSNYVSSDSQSHFLLESASYMKVTKSGNNFTVVGEFVFKGTKNGLAANEFHVIQVSIKFEAERESKEL